MENQTTTENRKHKDSLFVDYFSKDLSNLDLELRLLYDYVRVSPAQTAFTKELDSSISRLKEEKEERNMYLTYTSRMMECRRDGYEEGLHTGLTTGREEGISIGLEQGLERGAYENKLKTAKKVTFYGIIPRTSCPRNWASAGNGAEIGAN